MKIEMVNDVITLIPQKGDEEEIEKFYSSHKVTNVKFIDFIRLLKKCPYQEEQPCDNQPNKRK